MAKKKGKKRAKRRTRSRAPEVTLRFANEGKMAKANKGRKRTHHRKSKKHHGRRRRRHNPGTFMERLGKLAAGAAVAVGTGVLVVVGMSKIAPGNPVSTYGIPAAAFIGGVAVSKAAPTIGVGMALGSFTPFVLPIAGTVLGSGGSTAATARGLGRAFRSMRAIDMGAVDMAGGWDARSSSYAPRGYGRVG